MALDRDELAARLAAANLSNNGDDVVDPAKWAAYVVRLTDALLAALVPVAPASGAPAPLPGAPLAAPSRPEWVPKVGERVRVTRDNANHASVKAGDEYVVTSLGSDPYPETEAWGCGTGGTQYVRVCNLEPCAAPSPAASPAAYVPKVGDKVRFNGEGTNVLEGVVISTGEGELHPAVSIRAIGESLAEIPWRRLPYGNDAASDFIVYLRPATAAERVAAGLDAPAVDREGLAKALYAAVCLSNPLLSGNPWDEAKDVTKRDAFNAADAAIAFMAKGGAS